jgi:hypothetical protein
MRGTWFAAPLALLHYVALFVAIAAAVALAAASVSAGRFVRAGVESTSVRAQVRALSPFAAGLEVRAVGPISSDRERRARAVAVGRRLGFAEKPVLTTSLPASVADIEGHLSVVLMARSGAVQHVRHLSGGDPGGVWISSAIAGPLGLHPGGVLKLGKAPQLNTPFPGPAPKAVMALRVAGVYGALDADLSNPFWANFIQDIRAQNPDSSPPPTFVLVPKSTLAHAAHRLRQRQVSNVFEYPVDPSRITLVSARRLARKYALARSQFCRSCTTSSSLDSVLAVAGRDVDAISASIVLVTACGLVVSLVLAAAAGLFLVRRRADEAELLYTRGMAPTVYGGRVAVEALAPAAAGFGVGLLVAVLTVQLFAPAGTLDGSTLRDGVWYSAGASALALTAVALAAGLAFAGRGDAIGRAARGLRRLRLPWELLPLAVTGILVVLLYTKGGLAAGATGSHPRVLVFLIPLFAAVAFSGLAARALRSGFRGRARRAPVPIFLAVRRLTAGHGTLVAVVATAATAIAVFAYTMVLAASLDRTAAVKAVVSNGSDVQGLVDFRARLPSDLPFPAAIVGVDVQDFTANGTPVDVVAGDPSVLARVIRWGRWPNDPRPRLRLLTGPRAVGGALPALASPGAPAVSAIEDQGVRVPIRIVARVPIPGMGPDRPAVLVDRNALEAIAAQNGVTDPLAAADWWVWARGDPASVSRRLLQSSLAPVYLTTLRHVTDDPSVVAARRSVRYFETVGAIVTVLALLATVLYLQARRRAQLIASALVRRMGLRRALDLTSVAVETAVITMLALAVGIGVAVGSARLVVPRVDPLPQYAPGTILVYPWWTLAAGAAVVAFATTLLAAAVVAIAGRSSVAEALRLA